MKLYYDSDADLNVLSGKTIAILGYGSQGMPRRRIFVTVA